MSKNSEIGNIFYEIADILEMQGIAWKPRAYRQAAQSLESLKDDVELLYQKEGIERLEQIPNIGKALAKKIVEYIKTGKIKEHQRLLKTIPKHIRELMKIPGLGAKRIKKLNETLKIRTIKDLEKAAKLGKIRNISGFGEKSEKDILEAIQIFKASLERIPLQKAEEQANKIISQLRDIKEIEQIEVAGSIRRKKPFIRDIDILASSDSPEKVIDAFTKIKEIKKILNKGPTKATAILNSGIQADIRVLKPESWGAGLLYFTGNKNFNIMVRKMAIKKGYKLSEYGLFDKKTGKMIAGKTEKEIMKKIGLKLPKPEEREI